MSQDEQSNAISVRVKHAHRSRYKNQRRHDLRIGHQPGYVDGERSDLNRVNVPLPSPACITTTAKALRERSNPTRAMRNDAAVATIGIITFGHGAQPIFEALTAEEQDAAYLEVAERIADEYRTTLRGLVVHADETAPHAHVVWDCRNHDGIPMSRVMKGSRLQDIASEVIAKHATGIERGLRKSERIAREDKPSQIYNRSVQKLHQDLPAEIAAKEEALQQLCLRVDEMQARVVKLEEKETLNAKEAKRLMTYRKRLAARVEEYEDARLALDARTREATQQEVALAIKEKTLKSAEEELDAREDAMDRHAEGLAQREEEVSRRETLLDRLTEEINRMVGDIADRLGVGKSLRAIRDRLKAARHDLGDDGPMMG
ncbi:plasmid recombination protein [Loktanella agnita]|uniref:plasmid recombination protein n=1 Tax=Loktanella agnita TaxID=287097 RepID=UPI003989CE91